MCAFTLQKFASRGTSDPIVARTTLQTAELIKLAPIDDDKRKAVVGVALTVQGRLCTCADIADALTSRVRKELDTLCSHGLVRQSGGRVIELPHIDDLNRDAEGFLYSAKLCLRDIAGLFKPFFGHHYDDSINEFADAMRAKYGREDALVTMLADDRQWIAQLSAMRNGVEHPEHRRGPLLISNFALDQSVSPPIVVPPSWKQGDAPQSVIHEDMLVFLDNLLTFYEELFVQLLLKSGYPSFVEILEIPVGQRRPESPVRFAIGLRSGPTPQAPSAP